MTGPLDMGTNRITDVVDPVDPTDLAMRQFVEDIVPSAQNISDLNDKTQNIDLTTTNNLTTMNGDLVVDGF